MPGPGGFDALIERAARGGIGMPKTITRNPERLAILLARGLQSEVVHSLGKRHLYVKVILAQGVRDPLRRPL